jgi:hypothetical protein
VEHMRLAQSDILAPPPGPEACGRSKLTWRPCAS